MKEIVKELGEQELLRMYEEMLEIRTFEEKLSFLFLEGKMPGTIHQYIGMEACAVGVCHALKEDDVIASTHRAVGHAIAKGISIESLACELYGKRNGCCKGKGGSMHFSDATKGFIPAVAIVGSNIPIIMGVALAFKLRQEKRVAVSFFGDGASNEGAFHEGLNMASLYNTPAVFVCENNLYGASTHFSKTTRIENVADRAASYGMRGDIADGMNVLDVYKHAQKSVELARAGKGPTLLELKSFRLCGHSRRDPNNYMTKEEKEYWKGKDPIPFFEKVLKNNQILNDKAVSRITTNIAKKVDEAILFAQRSDDPLPEDTLKDLYVTMEVPE